LLVIIRMKVRHVVRTPGLHVHSNDYAVEPT
jgi:hypothetical protein